MPIRLWVIDKRTQSRISEKILYTATWFDISQHVIVELNDRFNHK